MRISMISAFAVALLLAPLSVPAQTTKSEEFVTVQPAGQWLAKQFIGQAVTNPAGERVGDINDLLFDKSGRIANVVIGVGGFLGIGEKNVAIPYNSLVITADAGGKRVISVPLSKERLLTAPEFIPTEKTAYMRAKEGAAETARDLADKAGKKIEEMKK
jgi:hypothetical protein